ncbi:ABATE domain-containing protein [Microbispora sp. NPDC049125]|uniref:CGNR zinc finger domain-containing protein n=1 Tax=Microbispora sp. NPDC049125 TaxID=3154929 RepID=UPI0034665BE9
MFTFWSGNLALDFAGTVGHRDDERVELLGTPGLLASWVVAAGLLDLPPAVDEDAHRLALRLREAVYRLGVAPLRGHDHEPGDVALVNELAAGLPVTPALVQDGEGLRLRRTGDLGHALASIARSAAGLLGGPDAARVRQCERPICTRLYVDTSRGGSRRWCDMRECGNREKAAAFRSRHRPPSPRAAGG